MPEREEGRPEPERSEDELTLLALDVAATLDGLPVARALEVLETAAGFIRWTTAVSGPALRREADRAREALSGRPSACGGDPPASRPRCAAGAAGA